MLPKTSANVKRYNGQTNTIWDKVNADIEKEFDIEHVYNKQFLKTKIKSLGDEVTDFHDKKMFMIKLATLLMT